MKHVYFLFDSVVIGTVGVIDWMMVQLGIPYDPPRTGRIQDTTEATYVANRTNQLVQTIKDGRVEIPTSDNPRCCSK